MENKKISKIEEVLKENLKSNVHIDKDFKDNLHEEILTEAQNKLINMVQMDEKSRKTKGNPKFLWAFGIITLVALLGVGAYLVISGGLTPASNSTEIAEETNPDDLNGRFGLLYVNDGSVKVIRDGNESTYSETTELFQGDQLITSEDAIADIKVNFGRIAMDANTGVTLNNLNNDASPVVDFGTIFISTSNSFNGTVNARTINADVNIESGSALVSQNSEVMTNGNENGSEELTWLKNLVSKAFATDGDSETIKDDSTKVISVAGIVKVVASGSEVEVENGKEVTIVNKVAGETIETSKDQFESEFYKTVILKEQAEGKDLGVAGDMTAPVVTIVSPAEGSTVTEQSLTITFRSNENGWFINENPWRDIVTNSDNTYTVTLNPGANAIKLRVKDYSYNLTEMTLNINYQAPYSVSWTDSVPGASGVYLAWATNGATAGSNSYVIYRNGGYYQTFPVRDETLWGANWTDSSTINGTTYTYIVKLMSGDTILAMSNEISVVAQTQGAPEPPSGCSVNLWRISGAQNPVMKKGSLIFKSNATYTAANVAWSSSNCDTSHGYKLVWNEGGSPVYPGSSYNYYSDPATSQGTVPSGTWYVRVCIYNGNGTCGQYSNELYGSF